jgi:hypothetical protein
VRTRTITEYDAGRSSVEGVQGGANFWQHAVAQSIADQ